MTFCILLFFRRKQISPLLLEFVQKTDANDRQMHAQNKTTNLYTIDVWYFISAIDSTSF